MNTKRMASIDGFPARIARIGLLLLLCVFSGSVSAEQFRPRWDALNEPGVLGRVESVAISPLHSQTLLAGGDVLGVGLSMDGGETWNQTTGITDCSEINDFTFHPIDPKTIWVGTLSGPYKSVDGGLNWSLKRTGMPPMSRSALTAPIQKVVFDPNNPKVLLAFGGNHRHMGYGSNGVTCWGAVWKSTDEGETWNKLTTIDDVVIGAVDDGTGVLINDAGFAAGSSSIVFACSDQGGVYRSTNGGMRFDRINEGLPNTEAWCLALHPVDPNVLWVGLGKGGAIYKSVDLGAHWFKSSSGITDGREDTQWRAIAVSKSNPDWLYCGAWNNPGSAYRSEDGGTNWIRIVDRKGQDALVSGSADPNPLRFQWMSIDPQNCRHVAGACESRVAESWDGGRTWRDLTSHHIGENWRGNGYSGLCCTAVAWNPFKPGQVFTLGMDTGKLLRSDDSLWSWKLADHGLIGVYNGANDVSFAQDGTIYVASGQFGNVSGAYHNEPIIKSTNWGRTWAYITRPANAEGDNKSVWANPTNSTQLWAIMGNTLYKSADGGGSWAALELKGSGNLWNLAADRRNPTTIYVGAQKGIFRSTDGTNFLAMPGSPISSNFEYVYLDPVTPGLIYAISFNSGSRGGVYRYDGAWKRIFEKPQARALTVDPGNPQRIAVMTKGWPARDLNQGDGIWISEDGGANWDQCNANLRMWHGTAIAFNPDKSGQLIAGMDGAGFYATDLGTLGLCGKVITTLPGVIETTNCDLHSSREGDTRRVTPLTTGNWLKFPVKVLRDGFYNVDARATSESGHTEFHLEANGVNVTGPMRFVAPQTPNQWLEARAQHVRLVAGEQYLKVHVEEGTLGLAEIRVKAEGD